jgi:hypothetical protein
MASTKPSMTPYGHLSENSGVVAYALGAGWIIVRFEDGWNYEYTAQSAGAPAIAEMQRLAAAGLGLCTYISRNVKEKYARKFR